MKLKSLRGQLVNYRIVVERACLDIAGDDAGALLFQIVCLWSSKGAKVSRVGTRSQPPFLRCNDRRFWLAKEWEHWEGYSRNRNRFELCVGKLEEMELISVAEFLIERKPEKYITVRSGRLGPQILGSTRSGAEMSALVAG